MSILKESVRTELRGILYEEATRWASSPEGEHFLELVLPKLVGVLERLVPIVEAFKKPFTVNIVHHFAGLEPEPEHDYPREGKGREPFGPIPPLSGCEFETDDHAECFVAEPGPLGTFRDCHSDGHYRCRGCARRGA